MNFVIFSYSFPPRCGAETFCSARFASALAQIGHNVHVVTMDHPKAISQDVYDFLVDRRITITRVPLADKQGLKILPRVMHRMRGREACDFANCINVLRDVLAKTESPVLVSRSMPEVSNMVAWHCRKYATKWIAHFSDPFPWTTGGSPSVVGKVFARWGLDWGRRIIRDADVVSVTCESAKRYFMETYGKVFVGKKVIVTSHIGEPPLLTSKTWKKDCNGTLVVHTGGLGRSRGAVQAIDAIRKLNADGGLFSFYQVGDIDKDISDCFVDVACTRLINDIAPDFAMAVSAAADVCFIPDMKTHLAYSPFLPSKFVYQVFSDTPIVVYSFKDSEMARYASRFPEAGIVFADIEIKDSLVTAFEIASHMDENSIRRDDIRALFSRRAIAALYEKI